MIDGGTEEVFSRGRRRGSQRVVRSVGTSFAGQVNGHSRAGGGVLGMIGPGIGGGFMGDIGGFERDGGVAGAIQAFGAFLANAEAPVGIVAKGKDENGIVGRLGGRGTCRQLLYWWRILAEGERGEASKQHRCREQNLFETPKHAEDGSPGHREYPVTAREAIVCEGWGR